MTGHAFTFPCRAAAALAALAAPVCALGATELSVQPLTLEIAAHVEPEIAAPRTSGAEVATPSGESPRATYGHAGSQNWTFGGFYANDFHQSNDFNLHFAYGNFLADEFEFAIEIAAWYFAQPGDDAFGISGSMVIRWHFLHADDYSWTFFGDAGMGILGTTDNVPEDGTSFNFLPRLGGGGTIRLGDNPDSPRLMLGLRWHHISNARIEGDERNPGRDGLAAYIAVVFPF